MTNYWQICRRAEWMRDSEPEAAVQHFMEASRLAKEAGDAKAALYIDHWALQTLIFRLRDFSRAYDLAVSAAVEARKPIHKDQMERICVHEDLINTYIGIDPIGYANLIEDALQYMEQEITSPIQCRHCLHGAWCVFELSRNQPENAIRRIQRHLAESENFNHHYASAHTQMCEHLHHQGAWEKLLAYAQSGERVIGNNAHKYDEAAMVLAAQALALRKLGQEAKALTAYRLATNKASAVKGPLDRPYYDLLCDFFLASGSLQDALALRERQLSGLINKGQPYWEAICRLQIARLLKQLRKPFAEQIEPIRALAAQLRKPEIILQQLAELSA